MTEDISLVTTLLNRNLELEETVRRLKQELSRKSSESSWIRRCISFISS